MTHWPVQCIITESAGRVAVAARDIDPGEIVFSEIAYVVSTQLFPSGKPARQVASLSCSFCGRLAASVHHTCSKCRGVYCSAECARDSEMGHVARGECMSRQLASLIAPHVAPEDRETLAMVMLLIARAVCEGNASQLRRLRPTLPKYSLRGDRKVDTVAFDAASLDPVCFLGRGGQTEEATYAHVQCLVHGIDTMDPLIRADFCNLYDAFSARRRKLSKMHARTAASVDYAPLMDVEVSCDTFVALCGAVLCNGFGMWDRRNSKSSTAMYPQSSFFNHSCAPNLGRVVLPHSRQVEFYAVKHVTAGEPLCLSYVDVKLATLQRQTALRATYGFDCRCPRCAPHGVDRPVDSVSSDLVPLMCLSCTSRILRPRSRDVFVCPTCDQTYTREGEPRNAPLTNATELL